MPLHQLKWKYSVTVDTTTKWTLGIFAILFLTTIINVRQAAWRDPTSVFFQPQTAYNPEYSDVRWRQAEQFLLDAQRDPATPRTGRGNDTTPEICIGMPSIARKGVRYLRSAVGSLLDGLRAEERDRIHIIFFFAEPDPNDHPAYHETWITGLADEILVYDLPENELERLRHLDPRRKGMFDFHYVLSACYETGAPFVTLIEDDVLAVDGWFPKTMSALERVERGTTKQGGKHDWLYLRMFYTEEYLGWNGEDVGEQIGWSVALIVAAAVFLIGVRVYSPRLQPYLPNSLILSVCCICLPLCIAFIFKAGRVTLFPPAHGVRRMEQYGCCSQGMIFNREETPALLDYIANVPSGHFFDMKVEQYADERQYLHRWAMFPPVLQHMGMMSSSNDSLKAEVAEKIWSFEFEKYDPDGLLADKRHAFPKQELV